MRQHMLNTTAFVAALAMLAGCSGEDPNGASGGDETSGSGDTTAASGSGGGTSTGSTTGGGNETTTGAGSSCANILGEGFTTGDIADNWELPNEVAEMVSLYDSCGKVIFFEEGSMW